MGVAVLVAVMIVVARGSVAVGVKVDFGVGVGEPDGARTGSKVETVGVEDGIAVDVNDTGALIVATGGDVPDRVGVAVIGSQATRPTKISKPIIFGYINSLYGQSKIAEI